MKRLAPLALILAACAPTIPDDVPVSGATTTSAPDRLVAVAASKPQPTRLTTTTTTTTRPPATVAPTTAPRVRVTGDCGGWRDLIAAHFPAAQVGKACAVMLCESNGNPNARNPRSSASGLFQFLIATHRAYGDTTYPTAADAPPASQIAAAARLYRARGWQPWVCA